MYNIENNEKFYVYDLKKQEYVAILNSMYELREYMYDIWYVYYNHIKYFTMEFRVRDNCLRRWFTQPYYDNNGELMGRREVTHYTPKHLVIFDKDFRIFNYTELLNEFEAHALGHKITYGIGHTYKGNPDTKSCRRRKVSSFVPGSKCVDRSRAHRCIKLDEQTKTFSVPNELITEIAEETNLSETTINKAMKAMRGSRKTYCREDLRSRDGSNNKYGCPVSWKNQKKAKQWSNKTYHKHHKSKAELILNDRYNEEIRFNEEINSFFET